MRPSQGLHAASASGKLIKQGQLITSGRCSKCNHSVSVSQGSLIQALLIQVVPVQALLMQGLLTSTAMLSMQQSCREELLRTLAG